MMQQWNKIWAGRLGGGAPTGGTQTWGGGTLGYRSGPPTGEGRGRWGKSRVTQKENSWVNGLLPPTNGGEWPADLGDGAYTADLGEGATAPNLSKPWL